MDYIPSPWWTLFYMENKSQIFGFWHCMGWLIAQNLNDSAFNIFPWSTPDLQNIKITVIGPVWSIFYLYFSLLSCFSERWMRSHFNGWQDYSWVLKRVIDFHCTLHKHELTGWQTCTHTVLSPRRALLVVLQNIAGAIDSTFELLVKFLSRCVSKKCINRRLKLEYCYYLSAEGFFVPKNKVTAAPGHLKCLE